MSATQTVALIVDGDRNIVYANDRAERIAGDGDGLSFEAGQLSALSRSATSKIGRVVGSACTAAIDVASGSGGIALVPRPSGRPHYALTVAPLSRKRQVFGPPRGLSLVIIRDPAGATGPLSGEVARTLGFSDAEADICSLFAAGMPLHAIAEERRVSIHTVRTQMKSVMQKSGVHSQSDLARLLVRLRGA